MQINTWGSHNIVIASIRKDGAELMPMNNSSIRFGYDDPRGYLPQALIELLDKALPAEGAKSPF